MNERGERKNSPHLLNIAYLQGINDYTSPVIHRMTNEELVLDYQSGNKDALEALYSQNVKMIDKIIRKYCGVEELDDLRQEAYFGIVKAAENWNPEKDCSFITYAIYWIRSVILRYIEECGGVVRIPSHQRALIGKYHRERNSYNVRFGRDPSDRELCFALGVSSEQLQELKKDLLITRIRSTSEIVGGDDDDLTLEDTIAAEGDQFEDVIDSIQHKQLSDTLWSCVDDLGAQKASVIRGRYKESRTLKECGESLGVSMERARQIERNALRELRKAKYTKRLKPYLTDQAAYTMGLKFTGFSSFEKFGSSQEVAMIRLEELSGMSLWHGKELQVETSMQARG